MIGGPENAAEANAKIVPQPFFLLRSTAVLWVYSFWHTYGLIHETLPMAALVDLTVVLTGCALLGQLRLWACGGAGHFSHGQALGGRGWPGALGQPSWPVDWPPEACCSRRT